MNRLAVVIMVLVVLLVLAYFVAGFLIATGPRM